MPQGRSGQVRKTLPPIGIDLRTVQPSSSVAILTELLGPWSHNSAILNAACCLPADSVSHAAG